MKSFPTNATTKSISSYTWTKSGSVLHTEINSIWTTHTKMQVNLHAYTENRLFSSRIQQPSQFGPPAQQPNQFHPYTEIRSNVYPPHWNQINSDNQVDFHAHAKNKWFSISIQVTSQFLPPTQQPNQFHPYTEIKSSSIAHTEIKSISTTTTKTKSISMLTRKTSNCRPAH